MGQQRDLRTAKVKDPNSPTCSSSSSFFCSFFCCFYNPAVSALAPLHTHIAQLTGPILASSFTSSSLGVSSSDRGDGLMAIAGSWGASTGLWGSGICSGRASASRKTGRCEICSMLPLRTRSRKDGRALRRGRRPSIQRRWWGE